MTKNMNVRELQALLTKLFPTCNCDIFREYNDFYISIFFDLKRGRRITLNLRRNGNLWEFGKNKGTIVGPRSLTTWEFGKSKFYLFSELGNAILNHCRLELSAKINAANKAISKLNDDLLIVTSSLEEK